jgi:hypothetical protein
MGKIIYKWWILQQAMFDDTGGYIHITNKYTIALTWYKYTSNIYIIHVIIYVYIYVYIYRHTTDTIATIW